LCSLTGCETGVADFTDDRLTNLLGYPGEKETWEKIEDDLSRGTVSVCELPTEAVRCDATTVSGHHKVTEDGISLSEVQKEILKRAGLKPSLYKDLEINKSPPQLTE